MTSRSTSGWTVTTAHSGRADVRQGRRRPREARSARSVYLLTVADPAKPMPTEDTPHDDEIKREWDAEIRRRAAELEAGRARLVPADEVFAKARKLIDDHRG